jgi:hypothetical protein
MAWGKNGTPVTLGSAGDDLDITDLTATKFNQFMIHTLRTGTGVSHNKRWLTTLDNNTATDYCWRRSVNGASEATATNQTSIDFCDATEDESEEFGVIYGVNIDGEEKLFIMPQRVYAFQAGAGNVVGRAEIVAKCDTTTNTAQYTRIDVHNDNAGSYETGSNLSALGSDLTPASAASFPTDVQVGSRAEITDTRKMYDFQVASTATLDDDFTSSGSTSHTSDNTTVGGWLAQDISYTKVNGSTDVMDINIQEDGTNDSISYDLGAGVSETKWVLRFKMNHSSRETNGVFFFGLSDKDSVSGETTAQDVIGIRWDGYGGGTTGRYGAFDLDGVALNLWNTMGENSINSTFSLSTDYFVEIKRTSATSFTVEIFTSSDYSTGSFGVCNGVTTSGVTGLRYIKLVNMMSSLTTHSLQGTIDDVKFYNGITSVLESSTWQEIGS